jgi:dihydroorotate dehydrogenase
MYKIIRSILFLFDPESIHNLVCGIIKISFIKYILDFLYRYDHEDLETELLGLKFKNPIGLAAGFDKNAQLTDVMSALGFGFTEVGTVTPIPQDGNEKPRLFRLVDDRALINRLGFNNDGVKEVKKNLLMGRKKIIIGGNIGKNRNTPNDEAWKDYETCFEELYDVVDYFVVNVSSPNTPDLRKLQEKKPLENLLRHIQVLNNQKPKRKPILLKIAPDLNNEQLDQIIEIVLDVGIDGIVATNTTITRDNLNSHEQLVKNIGEGGLSGKPLNQRSTQIIRYIKKKSKGSIPIIGVGGIDSPAEALEKLKAGASLLQLYTGFIYEGPVLIRNIKKYLLKNHMFSQ